MASGDLDWLFEESSITALIRKKCAEMKKVNESKELEPYWTGPGYRGEYQCPHGIGHGNHIHGCDGCCSRPDFPLNKKNLAKTRAEEILRGVGPFRVLEGD